MQRVLQGTILLQRKLFWACAFIKTGGLQRGQDLRLGQVQAVGNGIGCGLAAL